MKNLSLKTLALSAGALALLTGVAFAQNDTTGFKWSTSSMDTSKPLGSIDVTGAGSDPNAVGSYVAGLSGQEVLELVGRCNMILGINTSVGMNDMNGSSGVSADTTASTTAAGSGTAGGMAADTTSAQSADTNMASNAASGSTTSSSGSASTDSSVSKYDQTTLSFCQNLNAAIAAPGMSAGLTTQ